MKKKLLSLVLAGAMVASTSVSAFADTVSSEIYEAKGGTTYNVTDKRDANIEIEGKIANNQNVVTPSTISVTVPTAAKFTVNSAGELIGSHINITSQSDTEVKVIAQEFTDISGTGNINAVDLNTLNTENGKEVSANPNRKMVYLTLSGRGGAVSLQSNKSNSGNNTSGICGLTTSSDATEDEKVLGTVSNGNDLQLTLGGSAVKKGQALDAPLSDSFTLVLRLKKA